MKCPCEYNRLRGLCVFLGVITLVITLLWLIYQCRIDELELMAMGEVDIFSDDIDCPRVNVFDPRVSDLPIVRLHIGEKLLVLTPGYGKDCMYIRVRSKNGALGKVIVGQDNKWKINKTGQKQFNIAGRLSANDPNWIGIISTGRK